MKKKTIVAICYDFDKTLSPFNMQEQGFIQDVGYNADEFWRETEEFSNREQIEGNLAYMFKMVEKANQKLGGLTRERLLEYGEKITLFDGVADWFARINVYAKERGIIVEHYVISSGIKEIIEGTEIAKKGAFNGIYASSFHYDRDGSAVWPSSVVNYTNKTQFLFRVEKGVEDPLDDAVNDFYAPEELRVPFANIIYVGDSDTDVPCMALVNKRGGLSVGVYNVQTADKTRVEKMIDDRRISVFVPADYTENSPMDNIVKKHIDRISKNVKF